MSEVKNDFTAVFKDPDFVTEILNAKTGERVKYMLKEKGVILRSDDEIDSFSEFLVKAIEKKYKDSLENEDLENVSGGCDLRQKHYEIIKNGKIPWMGIKKPEDGEKTNKNSSPA